MGQRKISGLGFHRGKNGRQYWFTDTHVGGRPPKGQRVYETWGAIPRDDAEQRHKEVLDLVWRRIRGFGPPDSSPVSYTFEEASERYLLALRAALRQKETIRNYAFNLAWAARYLGGTPLDWIRVNDIERMRTKLQDSLNPDGTPMKRPLAFRTRKNIERVSAQFFKFAVDPARGWAERNPFDSLVSEKPPKGSRRPADLAFRRLHPREDSMLLDSCEDRRQRCAIAIGLYLGVRSTPTASLRIEDVNLFAGTICVPSEFNKGHSKDVRDDLWLPIPRRLLPFLKEQFIAATELGSPWLFPSGEVRGRMARTGHIHRDKLREMLIRAAAKIGYKAGVRFKSLRAICNNRLRAAGIMDAIDHSAAGARGILGHGSEEAARPYIDANVDHLRQIIEAFDRWLDQQSATAAKVVDMRNL